MGLAEKMARVLDLFSFVPDEPYLKMLYRIRTGQKLHLDPPVTFNEKQQFLKIHDHSTEYSKMVDKAAVKEYIADTIGEQYVVPMYGVWDDARDIDFDSLPDRFVLKCTHDSGSWIVCSDKSTFDREAAIKKLNKAVKRNYYAGKREWPYNGLKGRILAEKYLEDVMEDGKPSGKPLSDYKLFCFNGEPKVVLIVEGRPSGSLEGQRSAVRHIYDMDWNMIPLGIMDQKPANIPFERPAQLDEMAELSRKLSKGIPFLRVDFYIVDSKVLFGELTFYHRSGFDKFDPPKYQKIWGDYLDLSDFGK